MILNQGIRMMKRASEIVGMRVQARDGAIGAVDDLLFDDSQWQVRWFVIDTGNWLPGRKVLLPPAALRRIPQDPLAFTVELTKREVRESPAIEQDQPVSRQMEATLYGYYGWGPYWVPGAPFYGYAPPLGAPPLAAPREAAGSKPGDERAGDPHLRSANEVTGYYIEALDGSVGHVEDLLIDEPSAAVRYMLIDTKNWWPGKMVLVAPQWVDDISWTERHVRVALTRETVRSSPELDATVMLDRTYEEKLYRHYGFAPYWA